MTFLVERLSELRKHLDRNASYRQRRACNRSAHP